MGDVTFINAIAEKLVELLQSELGKVPGLAGTDVTLQSPTVLLSSRSNAPAVLSVFLYRTEINASSRKPPSRPEPTGQRTSSRTAVDQNDRSV